MLSFIKKFIKRCYRKLTRPQVLKKKIITSNRPPRIPINDSEMLYTFTGDTQSLYIQILDNKDKLFTSINPDDRVLININLNTAHSYPASTDNELLGFILDCLLGMSIDNIIVGDCSSITVLPTRKVFTQKNLFSVCEGKADIIFFDEDKWVNVDIDGEYLHSITLPEIVYNVDKIIYLSNIKTHRSADFSMGIKSAIGLMHPLERLEMHRSTLNEIIAETTLAIQPDLIILDGQKIFIDGGPTTGVVGDGNTIIIGNNLLDVDLAGYNLLYSMKKDEEILNNFTIDPFEMPQLHHAKRVLGDKR